jgi:hypothetical protein
VIALIGFVVSHPGVSKWIADAAQAEFVGTISCRTSLRRRAVAQPANEIRTVKALLTGCYETRLAPRSIVNSTSISPREWFMSDCDISKVRSLPFSEASTSDSRSDSAGAIPSNGSSSSRHLVPIAERAAERDQLLLAAAQQQRLALAHLGEFADHLVDEVEPRLAVEMPSATHSGSRMFSSTVNCGTRQRSSGM